MIDWPDIYFGPINLYSAPRFSLPHTYLELEAKYCKDVSKELLLEKQVEFNRLWNQRAREG